MKLLTILIKHSFSEALQSALKLTSKMQNNLVKEAPCVDISKIHFNIM